MAACIGLIVIVSAGAGSPGSSSGMTLVMVLVLLFLGCIAAVIASLYAYLGAVRFARTGSIREGIGFSMITGTIRNMGWLAYLIALLVLFVIAFIFMILTTILSLIPFIGWVLVMIVTPFMTIMAARYEMLVYEHGEISHVPAVPE